MKIPRFLFLFLLIGCFFSCQKKCNKMSNGSYKTKGFDSLQYFQQKAIQQSKQRNWDSALYFSHKMEKIAQNSHNKGELAKAQFFRGYYFREQNYIDSAIISYNKSISLYKELKDSVNVARKLLNLANIYKSLGNYPEASNSVLEAFNYSTDSLNDKFLVGLYNVIGDIKNSQKLYKESNYWYKKGLGKVKDTKALTSLKINFGLNYAEQGKVDSANLQWEQAKQLAQENEDTLRLFRILNNQAFYQWKKNPAYNPEAELLDIEQKRKNWKDFKGLQASYGFLSEYYSTLGNEQKAYNYGKKLFETTQNLKDLKGQTEALEILINNSSPVDSKTYSKLYIKLKDSLEKQSLIAKNRYELIRYDTENARNETANLRVKNAERKQTNQVYFFAIITLSLFFVFLIFYFIQKQKISKITHQKKLHQEIRKLEHENALKVHDELANGAHQILTLLHKNGAVDNKLVLEHAQNLYNKSRDLSYEMQPIDTEADFGQQMVNLANNYAEKVQVILKGWDNPELQSLNEAVKTQIYRVLQEILVNMKKHSGASNVIFTIKKENNNWQILYKDNGKGLNEKSKFYGNGLSNVENRMDSIGGSITFNSDNGLKITLNIPT